MSITNRVMMITDQDQACFTKMSTCKLQEVLDTKFRIISLTSLWFFRNSLPSLFLIEPQEIYREQQIINGHVRGFFFKSLHASIKEDSSRCFISEGGSTAPF